MTLKNAIIYNVAKDVAPINTLQNKGFGKMIKMFDKQNSINALSTTALPAL